MSTELNRRLLLFSIKTGQKVFALISNRSNSKGKTILFPVSLASHLLYVLIVWCLS